MSVSTSAASAVLPVFVSGEVPDGLLTVSQLKSERLKLAEGQEPAAWVRVNQRVRGWGRFPLYDRAGAVAMRPLSAKQQAAVAARRTCPECGETRDYVVRRRCQECVQGERRQRNELLARTCVWCKRVSVARHPVSDDLKGRRGECEPCWLRRVIRLQVEEEERAVWRRTCPGRGCVVVTATDEEIAAVKAVQRWWEPRWCPPCGEAHEREQAERRAEAERRDRERREAAEREAVERQAWAAAALVDPDVVVLDTETTGLDGDARIVEIAVLSSSGEVLLDTLVNPGVPIPAEASAVHGITDSDVQAAGVPSFADLLPRLAAALDHRRVLIYNASYDVGRLRYELGLHYAADGEGDAAGEANAWIGAMRFEDVMVPYSDWVGEWSDYHGGNRWQPLEGGHRAAGDCRAVLDCLRAMGRPSDEVDPWETAEAPCPGGVGLVGRV